MRRIKTKLSAAIISIVLLTVSIISLLSNYLINKQFTEYIARQQELRSQIITATLSQQYSTVTGEWDMDYIHNIGMLSLYEGYILKVYDNQNRLLWDAQAHDMALCNQIMGDISERMRIQYPQLEGEFHATAYPLIQSGIQVGTVSISYFGPFFLTENDLRFLAALNKVLISVGLASLLLSIIIGNLLAERISRPILKTVDITKEISDGNYGVRLNEKADTKELNLLVGSINQMAQSLENLERLRKQLTEDVAHELRTPITILQTHLEAMLEGFWEPTSERMQSCYDETVRISKLVYALESLARIESDTLQLNKEQLSVHLLIRKVIAGFEGELTRKAIKLEVLGSETEVTADRDRLQQVLVNLLSNAIKYTETEGYIRIEVSETQNSVSISVKDNGIGIPEEDMPYIFERFYRADKSRNRATGGSGIGLTIVKAIVEAHGGRVLAESRLQEGSSFTVVLPKETM